MNQTFSQSEKNRPLSASADPELELELVAALRQMHDEISTNSGIPHLSAVVLGGSYGRGEGGCVRDRDGRSHPHNDLDFFVFTSGARKREQRRINAALAEIGRRYARTLGIDVDFAPAREEKTLSCVSRTLMFQELRRGYRILYGTNAFLKYLPRLPFEKLPAAETLRLLMNRGVGLLLALQKSISSPGEEEFIRRNHAKAVLGCGDALLLASGRYSASAIYASVLRRRPPFCRRRHAIAGQAWRHGRLSPERRRCSGISRRFMSGQRNGNCRCVSSLFPLLTRLCCEKRYISGRIP